MMYKIAATLILLQLALVDSGKYEDNWESIDSRPLPSWYDEVKFGIFCHWGVYSVPAYKESAWLWWYWKGSNPNKEVVDYMNKNFKPGFSYADFAQQFTAEFFDAIEFAEVVQSAGAKYFVLTSKHVEGFTMWPSKHSWNWNSMDNGPRRDIVGELKAAFKNAGVHFGLYYCLYEWFHSLYEKDTKTNTTDYVEQVSYPQLQEIVREYEPDIVWSDGEYEKSTEYWKSLKFLAWLYNESPIREKVVVNDRWGAGTPGHHGGYLTFEDHYDPGHLIARKWENCMTIDKKAWGFRREIKHKDVHTVHELIEQLARTISCNGNLLLNVGPDNHGRIPLIFQDRLREFGNFVSNVSEAIYGTKPWIYQSDEHNIWYTARFRNKTQKRRVFLEQMEKETIVYAWVLDVPEGYITLKHVIATDKTVVSILGTSTVIRPSAGTLIIKEQEIPWRRLPRQDVIVFKIEYAASELRNPLSDARPIRTDKKDHPRRLMRNSSIKH